MDSNFANEISTLCLKFFEKLPKTGKPNDKEWTVLSAIVKSRNSKNDVVALGTGTKCIGASQMSNKGDILNDSHAEICCRRAFIRYILYEMSTCENQSDERIFKFNKSTLKFELKSGVNFNFFTTSVPCGDANIFSQIQKEDENDDPPAKKIKLAENVGFTGAKLIKHPNNQAISDEMEQTEGAIRIKPGKGIRTLSLSCSDKLARWNFLGIQGCMLFSLLENPIYLKSFILSGDVVHSVESLERALFGRFSDVSGNLKEPFKHQKPLILIASKEIKFKYSKNETRINASANSLNWSLIPENERPLEVSVSGKRQGVTKKQLNTPKAILKISKCGLFLQYLKLLKSFQIFNLYSKEDNLDNLSYNNMKTLETNEYFKQWQRLKKNYFSFWTDKPENLLDFSVFA